MSLRRIILSVWALAVVSVEFVAGQDFGVMESAETVQPGNFKLVGYPMLVFSDAGLDNELGLVLRGGYGFTEALDVEIVAAGYDQGDLLYLGANLEVVLLRPISGTMGPHLAGRGGLHRRLTQGEDNFGVDLTALVSTRITEPLELIFAVDFTRELLDAPNAYNTLHLVPGVEYRVSRSLDVLGEFGLAVSDIGRNYASAGLAFYLR